MSEKLPDVDEELVQDAEQVVAVAVRLGRLRDATILSNLDQVKASRNSGSVDLGALAALRKSLNAAIGDIAPITIRDLRSGWSPFVTKRTSWGVILAGVFAIALMCLTAYMTLLYNRVSVVHATLVELQTVHAQEQTTRLFNLFRKNEGDMRDALENGHRELATEVFYKNLFDLQSTYEKLEASISLAPQVTEEAAIFVRLQQNMIAVARWMSGSTTNSDPATAAALAVIQERAKSYSATGVGIGLDDGSKSKILSPQPMTSDTDVIDAFFSNLTIFVNMIGLPRADPRAPVPLYDTIFRLREALNSIAFWYLPALYGMLGSVIFYMRRFLDPNIPDPSWMHTTYRVFLGAFAGIIVVWFWAPSLQKGSDQVFSNMSSFGVAFLVGFSIDIFFQVVDRLVTNVGQAIGKA